MSSENDVNPPAPNLSHNSSFSLLSVLGRERLTCPNYMDWMRNLRFTLRYENKEYVLDEPIPTINDDSTQKEIEAHQKHYDDANKKGKAAQGKSDRGSKRKVKSDIAPTSDPKEAVCFYCNTKGHWKCSCPKYLKDLKDRKVKKGDHLGIYKTIECISNNGNVILNVGSSYEIDKSKLWHSRLRTSSRVSKPPQFYYGFHIKDDKISDSTLSELDEPTNYKEAMAISQAANGSVVVFLVLYVDDILLIGNDIPTLQSVKDWLGKCFAMKDLGDATYILGIKIYRDRSKRLIGLSQDTYIDKILKRFKMENSEKRNLPLHHGIKISKDLCPKTDEELDKMNRNPSECHWTVIKNILKYLRNTKDEFLVYGREEELEVTRYCDASWKTNKDDSHSHSACEASKEAIWMENFIRDFGVVQTVQDPIEIFCDNESAVRAIRGTLVWALASKFDQGGLRVRNLIFSKIKFTQESRLRYQKAWSPLVYKARDIKIKDSKIVVLNSKLEKISNEKNALDVKIRKFANASQSLDKLFGSQITDNSKSGLGYVSYNDVPPPHTSRFSPPRIDLSHTDLLDFAKLTVKRYEVTPIEVVTQTSSVKIYAPVKENIGAQLIEDWESNKGDDVESPPEKERKNVKPSVHKVEVEIPKQNDKPARRPVKYIEMYRTQRPRVPKAMLTRTGLKLVNSVRPVNPKRNFFKKINTAKEKANTTRLNSAVLNDVRANKGKAVKASAFWVWRPIKLDSASIVLKKHTYIDARGRSKSTLVDFSKGRKAIGTKWVFQNKKDERGIVIRNKARLVAQGCTQEEGIDYDEVFTPVARIKAIRLFLAYASFIGFLVYQMDVKNAFLYGRIEKEVYVCQPLGFEDPDYPDKVYKVKKALYGLYQAPRAWSMIGSMMYLTSSRPEIMFVVYSDYAGASLDKKSASVGCQFLGSRLISWQCKKQTVVATSTTKAEYVAAASCCGQLKQYSFEEIKILFDNTMESIRRSAEEELGQEQKVEEEIAQQEDVEKESSKKVGGRLKRKTSKAREDKDKRQKKQDDPKKLTFIEYVEVISNSEEFSHGTGQDRHDEIHTGRGVHVLHHWLLHVDPSNRGPCGLLHEFLIDFNQTKTTTQDPFIHFTMATTDKESSAAGMNNRPPMLEESDFDSWKIRIQRYIRENTDTEVHTHNNHFFENVNHQVTQAMHLEEKLNSDVDSDIDDYDNIIPYHQYQSNTKVENVPTEAHINNKKEFSTCPSLSTLEIENTQLKEELTVVRIKNDSLRDENVSIKARFQELYKSKVGSNNSVSSGATIPVKPKAVAAGLYAMTLKYVPPQKRINRETNSSLPRKETVTVVNLSNVLVNLPTGIKYIPARSKKVKRVAKPLRNVNKKNRVDSSLSDKRTGFISKFVSVCKTCNECLVFGNHDECVVKSVNEKNPRS
nr:ribonuclease H-like domain-containing protein [Tanacetum cinerariifolium]